MKATMPTRTAPVKQPTPTTPEVPPALPEPASGPLIIPTSDCPPELKYLGVGKTVGLRIMGRLVDGGVLVETCEFIR